MGELLGRLIKEFAAMLFVFLVTLHLCRELGSLLRMAVMLSGSAGGSHWQIQRWKALHIYRINIYKANYY